jgi:hypothetical protein
VLPNPAFLLPVVNEVNRGLFFLSRAFLGISDSARRKRFFPLLLYMGTRADEQVEQEQKVDLAGDGVQVLTVPAGQQDYTAGIEGLKKLREGGLVSVAGDRTLDASAGRLEVTLLGHRVALPRAPHVLALLARAPLIPFFALRLGRRRYHFVAYAGRAVEPASRAEREASLQRSAQWYADRLAEVLRRHPDQWYHFEPWLGPPAPPRPLAPPASDSGETTTEARPPTAG